MRIFLTLLLLSLLATSGYCQIEEKLIEGLNSIIKPITTVDPEARFDDLAFLQEIGKEATIIGIGESTHGTQLYNIYRQRIIRFLVQEMEYEAIVDEGDILAAEKLDAYINHQTDSLEIIGNLRPVITNKDELDWLRSYNKNKPENERVHIYGAEVRGFYGIIQKLRSLSHSDEIVLEKFTGDVGAGYRNITKKDFEQIKKVAEKWNKQCNNSQCSHYLSLLNQQIDFAYRQRFGKNDFNIRDGYMFENIKSIVSNANGNKVIILSHNGHLQKTKFESQTSLGYLLNTSYANKYFVLATNFNTGYVKVYNGKTGHYDNIFFKEVNDKEVIEYYFKQCMYPNFILPVNLASESVEVSTLVKNEIKMLRNLTATGDVIKSSVRLAENYDLIIFFNNTNGIENH